MESFNILQYRFLVTCLLLPIIVECAIFKIRPIIRSYECPVLLEPPPMTRSLLLQNKVLNGDRAYESLKDYIGTLYGEDGPICTCTVIAPKIVITDGTCAISTSDVIIGDIYGNIGQRIAVKEKIVHADFGIPEYNFGILILEVEITTGKNIT